MASIYLQTMGCDKNTADSSVLMALLKKEGHRLTDDIKEAQWAIINTCGFILPAKEESIGEILWMAEEKKERPDLGIIAIGCLVEKYEEELRTSLGEVDAFFGVFAWDEILDYIGQKDKEAGPLLKKDQAYPHFVDQVSAYLKIADGCDSRCSYCAIPAIKGPYHSRPYDLLLKEARDLADQGVKELILVAQDTTAYGCDLAREVNLVSLLEGLVALGRFKWIRILYAYPDRVDQQLIECMKRHPSIVNYLDMPLQHIDDSVLKKMGRRHGKAEIVEKINMIRSIIPDMVFRSTFITGFPQEDPAAFDRLVDFLSWAKIQWVGAFTYSQEDGTPAAGMSGQIEEAVKEERYGILMEEQQKISQGLLSAYIGKSLEVLVEEKLEAGYYTGRAFFMTKDVDGMVSFRQKNTGQDLALGSFVDVEIVGASAYDLIGEIS